MPIRDCCDDPLTYLSFLGRPADGRRFLGAEVELDTGRCRADDDLVSRELHDVLGEDFVISKWESGGFELVTAPASIEVHRERWNRLAPPWVRPRGLRAWQSLDCGMHVHVSRTAVDDPIAFRRFINRPDNSDFLDLIAGRPENHWCRRLNDPELWRKGMGTSKGRAVSEDARTFEVRIFKSSLNPRRILASLEFVDALVHYLNQRPPEPEQTWRHFTASVSEAVWPNLFGLLTRRGVSPAARV